MASACLKKTTNSFAGFEQNSVSGTKDKTLIAKLLKAVLRLVTETNPSLRKFLKWLAFL